MFGKNQRRENESRNGKLSKAERRAIVTTRKAVRNDEVPAKDLARVRRGWGQ